MNHPEEFTKTTPNHIVKWVLKERQQFVWPSSAKPCSCASLKPTQKGQKNEMKFTFDVSKCDRIFDELLRLGHIKISHIITPLEELKWHAY